MQCEKVKRSVALAILCALGLAIGSTGGVARSDTALADHLELALLIDGSGSMSRDSYAMQLTGHVQVLGELLPADGTVSVGVWQFNDSVTEEFALTVIDSDSTKATLLDVINGLIQPGGETAIEGAILAATSAFTDAGHLGSPSWRQIIDVSTDGWSGSGNQYADAAADDAVAAGVEQVNAILVGDEVNDSFVRGVDAFSFHVKPFDPYDPTVNSFGDYTYTLRRKLATELGLPLPHDPGQPPSVSMPENIFIMGPEFESTTLTAIVSDPDGDTVTCMWGWWSVDLTGMCWLPQVQVDGSGAVTLDLGETGLPGLPGAHALYFRATDRELPPLDWWKLGHKVVVTVENSPPVVAVEPGGILSCTEEQRVTIGGATVSDWDGDAYLRRLVFKQYPDPWIGDWVSLETLHGGEPVTVPAVDVGSAADFGCGVHTFWLQLYDPAHWVGWEFPIDVTIVPPDTTAPLISAAADPGIMWPPNHRMVDVIVEVNATDDRDDQLDLSVQVFSDEPPETDGDGNFLPDHEIVSVDAEAGLVRLRLRAERSGKGDGRTYTIDVTVTDDAGNSSTATLTVVAPHDMKKRDE